MRSGTQHPYLKGYRTGQHSQRNVQHHNHRWLFFFNEESRDDIHKIKVHFIENVFHF